MSLPITGQDTVILILENGALIDTIDQVISCTQEPRYQDLEVKPIGTSKTLPFKDLNGWSGQLEVAVQRPAVDDLIDRVNASRRTRSRMRIDLRVTDRYRTGETRSYTYPDVQLSYSKRVRRDDPTTVTLDWNTGSDRITG